jgi:8-oxo-dGTP pyrophosphatase MutT (NUDIX family)
MTKKTGQIVSFAEFRLRQRAFKTTAVQTHSHPDTQPCFGIVKEHRPSDQDAAPPLLAADPATFVVSEEPLGTERLLQSGALAYRRAKNGELRILLIRKRRSKEWGIPKGKAEAHLSFSENAAKEAFEEAGVRGSISPNSVGMFRATKRSPSRLSTRVIEVWIYLLEVTECLSHWPEKGKRQTKWVPCDVAATELREPVLVDLCHRLAHG